LLSVEKERERGCRPSSLVSRELCILAFVPFNRKMVRTAASSEAAGEAKSLPFMSFVDASSMEHEDDEPELSIRDQV
jgi:hypothetical protein